ncbi:unknown [Clostridium sp. CAG:768]|nr:unknown [Clostridium sp. CAG:768]
MTLPAIISSYKKVELENRFKKASSTIENAVIATVTEYAMDDLLTKKSNENINATIPDELRNEMNETFSSKLNIGHTYKLKLANVGADPITHKANLKPVYGFLTGKQIYPLFVYNLGQKYILNDGTSVSLMIFQKHGVHDGIKVVFDTNGAFRGPNRFGYDIFIYDTGYWNANTCSDEIYSYGCYKYAQQNINPQEKSKSYWKNLKI